MNEWNAENDDNWFCLKHDRIHYNHCLHKQVFGRHRGGLHSQVFMFLQWTVPGDFLGSHSKLYGKALCIHLYPATSLSVHLYLSTCLSVHLYLSTCLYIIFIYLMYILFSYCLFYLKYIICLYFSSGSSVPYKMVSFRYGHFFKLQCRLEHAALASGPHHTNPDFSLIHGTLF